MSQEFIVCPECKVPDEDFFYGSKFAEDQIFGWRCLGCKSQIKDNKISQELDRLYINAKIECISMDMQSVGELTRQNSPHEEMSQSTLDKCKSAGLFDEKFIIETLQNVAQGQADE